MSELLEALVAALPEENDVFPSNGPEVTEFYVVLPGTGPGKPGTEHLICLARDFNRPGYWEAMLDKNGDASGLPDGPASDCPPTVFATWVRDLVDGLRDGTLETS